MTRMWMAGVAAAALAGCRPAAPAPAAGDGGPAPPPAAGTGNEFGTTHHATVSGVVVGPAGEPLDSVAVAVYRPVDPQQGTTPQLRALSGPDGRFTLRVPMFVAGQRDADTTRVGVMLRAYGEGSRYRRADGSAPMDSATVWVTMVPKAQPPRVFPARLTPRFR
ncbi:MAG TPA: hypothetical protein VF092_27160 [Longimicrobium sp.]